MTRPITKRKRICPSGDEELEIEESEEKQTRYLLLRLRLLACPCVFLVVRLRDVRFNVISLPEESTAYFSFSPLTLALRVLPRCLLGLR